MTLNIETHERVPFHVESVVVTAENRPEVAEWCGGNVDTEGQDGKYAAFIRVPVKNPTNDRRTKAYDGDRVVKLGREFKVYDEKAFLRAFQPKTDKVEGDALETVTGTGQVINVYINDADATAVGSTMATILKGKN